MVSAEPSVENAESRVLLLSSSVCREAVPSVGTVESSTA